MCMYFPCYQCAENKELQERILFLEQELASISGGKKSPVSEIGVSDDCADELRKKVQSQVGYAPIHMLQS